MLCYGLEQILRLLHPMAPMVTERIYSELPWADKGQLSVKEFPLARETSPASAKELAEIAALKAAVEGIRNFRTENKISPKTQVTAYLEAKDSALWQRIQPFVVGLARLGDVHLGQAAPGGFSGKVATPDFNFTFPLEGLVDKSAEKTRLQAEIKKVRGDVEHSEKRLNNEAFIAKAKPELVADERAKAAAAREKLKVLEEALVKLG